MENSSHVEDIVITIVQEITKPETKEALLGPTLLLKIIPQQAICYGLKIERIYNAFFWILQNFFF